MCLSLHMAVKIEAKYGANVVAHLFSTTLVIPDGPGALCELIFVSAVATRSVVNTGNLDRFATGGFRSSNVCSSQLRGHSGGKNVLARHSAFISFEVTVAPFCVFRSGIHCLP